MASNHDIETHEPVPPDIADAVIFYCEADRELVEDFKKQLEKKLNDARVPAKFHLHLLHEELGGGRILQEIGDICDISVQHWFYVTQRWIDDENQQFHKDENIMQSLKKRDAFIPIWSKKKEDLGDLPYGVSAFTGMYAEDDKIVDKLKKHVFDSDDHQKKKQELQKKWSEKQKVPTEKQCEDKDKEMEQLSGDMSRTTVSDTTSPYEEWDGEKESLAEQQ